ncbi:MFS general substrate transporter [Mycena rebaudengoi]|nr:MFS general substrate transporter [Mycena rebaudengoi]
MLSGSWGVARLRPRNQCPISIGSVRTTQFSEEYNAKLRRKLDLMIPPLCAAVYFTQYLDMYSLFCSVISSSNFDMTEAHNLVSAAFYYGFLAFEFPTVYISQKLRVAKYLGGNIVVWDVILMLHSVGTSFGAFFAMRFLLGMCESCVAPILILIISMFYKKNEQATRISWFYAMNGVTSVFGGFVAFGISHDSGCVLPPYKIIYLLLGGLAILVGVAVLIWMPDSPVHAKFLDKEERVRNDRGGTESMALKREQVIEALLDIRTWLILPSTLLTSIPNGGLSNFSNMIIKSFGYRSKQGLILSTPGGAVHALATLFCGWYSDRKGERMIPILFALVPTIVGAAILIGLNGSGQKGALLFGIYIIGTFGSALSTIYACNSSNTSGHTKKSTINSLTLATFSVGNIIGTEIFAPKDAPAYIPGKISIMVLLSIQIVISLLLGWMNIRLNVQKRAVIEKLKAERGWSDADVQRERDRHAFLDMMDKCVQSSTHTCKSGSLVIVFRNLYFVYTA